MTSNNNTPTTSAATSTHVDPATAKITPRPRTVLMETNAFYRWLEELVGIDPDTGDYYPADFVIDMDDDEQSVFTQMMGYTHTECGPVVALFFRKVGSVEVLVGFEPTTNLRQIVDLMVAQADLKAA
ncbi:hypothetical protein [Pseudogemmobacter faecipullorum]|uniref:Uncharacterized protein n=1 Tax=Pseudogemmobacter faecipullorum TaxID=2755041 RepID=A0ABS8CII0_9RHOB|nr:hypothetical protein [Pseudogemmobacter faecipullorum]MCB5409166.1 hypothetical protein [Pseudogemmobacter faecipullorum]